MKPPPFDHHVPESLEHALELLREHGDEARPLAGGQSLVPMLNFRLARPSVLIDLNRLPGLSDITALDGAEAERRLGPSGQERTEGVVHVGAMVRERSAERSSIVQERLPLLAAALPLIGHEAIRTRGTLGGSMAHADPAAELPAVAVAAGAQLVLRSTERGERVVEADDFFQGYFATAIEPDELLVELRLPELMPGTGVRFEEVARRQGDFAMAGVLAALHVTDGVIDDARLALIGVADRAVRAREAEASLIGAKPDGGAFAEAAATAVRHLEPMSDLHGSSAYRKHIAERLVRRALDAATPPTGSQVR